MKKYVILTMGGHRIELDLPMTIEQLKGEIEKHVSAANEYIEFPHPDKRIFLAPGAIIGFEVEHSKAKVFGGEVTRGGVDGGVGE